MNSLPTTSFIHPDATLHGTGIRLGDHCSVWPSAVIRSDGGGSVTIGSHSNVQDGAVIHGGEPDFPVEIGDYVTVAHRSVVHGARLANNVCIGIGAIVLDGCVVEENVILGAGSVAAPGTTLKSGWLYLGSPAKPVRELKEKEVAWLRKNADLYVALCQENLAKVEAVLDAVSSMEKTYSDGVRMPIPQEVPRDWERQVAGQGASMNRLASAPLHS